MAETATKEDLSQLKSELKAEMSRLGESLITFMQESFARIDQRFDEMGLRFDAQATRLDRHAALLQTGSRWSVRMNEWAERIDVGFEKRDRQIAEILERIRKLEERT
jgi:hypothetical protein